MRSLIICLSSIGLLLVGCVGSDRPSPSRVTSPQVPSDTAASPTPFSQQPPLVPASTNLRRPVDTVPGLTPPTNPDQRANLAAEDIEAGRSDPFAPVPGIGLRPSSTGTPTATVPVVTAVNSPTVGVAPLLVPPPPPIVMSQLPGVTVPSVAQSAPPIAPQVPTQAPTQLPALPPQTAAPVAPVQPAVERVPPEPASLARLVKVTGVVQVQGKLNAIVQVPQESSPRSVQAGEYLANGAIRVKQIQMNPNQEPVVILEENGKTVARTVGG